MLKSNFDIRFGLRVLELVYAPSLSSYLYYKSENDKVGTFFWTLCRLIDREQMSYNNIPSLYLQFALNFISMTKFFPAFLL